MSNNELKYEKQKSINDKMKSDANGMIDSHRSNNNGKKLSSGKGSILSGLNQYSLKKNSNVTSINTGNSGKSNNTLSKIIAQQSSSNDTGSSGINPS